MKYIIDLFFRHSAEPTASTAGVKQTKQSFIYRHLNTLTGGNDGNCGL